MLSDSDENRFYIAWCLSFLDSRTLPSSVRVGIGLDSNIPLGLKENESSCLPILLNPIQKNYLGLCPNSEGNLHKVFDKLGDRENAPLYLNGC